MDLLAIGRRRREEKTLAAMIAIFCEDHHPGPHPCDGCRALLEYARGRLGRCPYGDRKPTCLACPIHCYRPTWREEVREVMRHAGPKMLRRHPVLAILHLLDGRRPPPGLPGKDGQPVRR